MIALKNMLDNLDISIHNIERYTIGREWNYRRRPATEKKLFGLLPDFGV
jgi:hypothetical protein